MIENISTLLLHLSTINKDKTYTETYYDYPITINIECLEMNNNLILILIGSGIGWFLTGYNIAKFIKNKCFKRRNNEEILLLASHIEN